MRSSRFSALETEGTQRSKGRRCPQNLKLHEEKPSCSDDYATLQSVLQIPAVQDNPITRCRNFNLLDGVRDALPTRFKREQKLPCRGVRYSEIRPNRINWYGENAITPAEAIGAKPQRSIVRNEGCAEIDWLSVHRLLRSEYSSLNDRTSAARSTRARSNDGRLPSLPNVISERMADVHRNLQL